MALALVAGACGARRPITVDPRGSVGRLAIDAATPGDIVRVAGRPDLRVKGTFDLPGERDYLALAYGCSADERHGVDPGAYRPTNRHCRTVYLVSPLTGRFAAFWTSDPRFETPDGTQPGMREADADRREHAHARVGAFFGIYRTTRRAILLIENAGCTPTSPSHPNPCLGGRVADLSLESRAHPVGLQFE